MIKSLRLKSGPRPGSKQTTFSPGAVTIFVGPNHSGKSRVLQELDLAIASKGQNAFVVLDGLEFKPWSREEILDALGPLRLPDTLQTATVGFINLAPGGVRRNSWGGDHVHLDALVTEAKKPQSENHHFGSFLSLLTLPLDGKNRLVLTESQPAGDLQSYPKTHIGHLFRRRDIREQLRRIVYDAFGVYLVVDPTDIGKLRFRLSPKSPSDEREEKGWEEAAIMFHAQAPLLSESSDGVKAFVGIMAATLAGDPRLLLIDEPEAFLHPTLCAQLGRALAGAALGHRQLFVATHSASFLMGCLQTGAEVNIVRLSYERGVAGASLLPNEKLRPLLRNPMLRSAGVFNGLFHRAVVVAEGDADRAFYQELNQRLLDAGDVRGIPGCLFLNAQNKQTVWDIVAPLRSLGIPAVGVVDLDVLKEGGTVWTKPLLACRIPTPSHEPLQLQRAKLEKEFTTDSGEVRTRDGMKSLSAPAREACEDLLEQLARYGMFVVPVGEVEGWLASLDVPRSKGRWLNQIFESMGEDPSSPSYVSPSEGDCWEFLGNVATWVANQDRKGMPE